MTLKLEVGKTYIDNIGIEWGCVLARHDWFYCVAPSGDGNDLFAFDEDGNRPADAVHWEGAPPWRIVKEKVENKIWLNVYMNEVGKPYVRGFLTKDKADEVTWSPVSGWRIKCLCLDLDNVTVEEM